MTADVYFYNRKTDNRQDSLVNKLSRLFKQAGFAAQIEAEDLVGIKMHFGERGNNGFIRPMFARRIVEEIKAKQGKPFLTDANTLYSGERDNSIDHLNTAIAHGFGYSTVQAPLVIADGLQGKNFDEIEVDNCKHFDTVKIGSEAVRADGLISLAHFKGHELSGFGGAIKNVGMGLGSRSGKQMMHAAVEPEVTAEECIACGKCAQWCAHDAITVNEIAVIDPDQCVGCGECIVTCPTEAISPQFEDAPVAMQERMAEFTLGAIKNKRDKVGYINFVMNVSPDCDCAPWSDRPIVSDVGILASQDPVALDQACYDLVNQKQGNKNSALQKNFASGEDKFAGVHPDIDPQAQLKHGAEIGLGTREYNLVELD